MFKFQPNQRNTFALNFTYAQGRPTTPPISSYITENNTFVPIYAERNQFRVPSYHRLDIAYTLGQSYKKDKLFQTSWTFSIYNVYSRENAYSVFFERGAFNLPEAKQLSILGSAFPAITLNIQIL